MTPRKFDPSKRIPDGALASALQGARLELAEGTSSNRRIGFFEKWAAVHRFARHQRRAASRPKWWCDFCGRQGTCATCREQVRRYHADFDDFMRQLTGFSQKLSAPPSTQSTMNTVMERLTLAQSRKEVREMHRGKGFQEFGALVGQSLFGSPQPLDEFKAQLEADMMVYGRAFVATDPLRVVHPTEMMSAEEHGALLDRAARIKPRGWVNAERYRAAVNALGSAPKGMEPTTTMMAALLAEQKAANTQYLERMSRDIAQASIYPLAMVAAGKGKKRRPFGWL